MNAIDRAGPYVDQLLHNDDVRADLERAVRRAGQAYGGAKAKQGPRRALGDRRVRSRAVQSAAALRDGVLAVQAGREKAQRETRRRHRRRWLALVLCVAGGAYLAVDESARTRLLTWAEATGSSPGGSAAPTETSTL